MSQVVIGVIGQLLTLSVVTSIRMFLPGFLYFLIIRVAKAFPQYLPDLIVKLAEQTPAWQTSWPFLTVLGILAAVELAAVRDPGIKHFLIEDFDRYAKPVMSALLAFCVVTSARMIGAGEAIDDTAVSAQSASLFGNAIAVAAAAACGAVTAFCCKIRGDILEKIHAIDPENCFYLQTLANCCGELVLAVGMLLIAFLPLAALIVMLGTVVTGILFKLYWVRHEAKHVHQCAACLSRGVKKKVCDCAVLCPECGTLQPRVCKVGWFGLSSSALETAPPEKHAFDLLSVHRCRWCASPLNRKSECDKCHRPQWDNRFGEYYVKRIDTRFAILMVAALLSFSYPTIGLLIVLALSGFLTTKPFEIHIRTRSRIFVSFLMLILNLTLTVLGLLLSTIPVFGLLTLAPFIVRYSLVRRAFVRRFIGR